MDALRVTALLILSASIAAADPSPNQIKTDLTSATQAVNTYRRTMIGKSSYSAADASGYLVQIGYLQAAIKQANDYLMTTPTVVLRKAEQDYQRIVDDRNLGIN